MPTLNAARMLNIDDRLIKEVSPKIGANALSVLLAIAIHLNQKTNRAFPSHHRLMELTGLGRDAVYNALRKLQEAGLLKSVQAINSKKKTFGRREFKVSTRFIKIFIDAEDAEPLPENPYTAHPYTAHPDTENQETYQLNNIEQINKEEQINKNELSQPEGFSDPVEETELEDHNRAAPLGGNFETWVQNLTTDRRVFEGFCVGYKIPSHLFEEYVTRFKTIAAADTSKYHKQGDVTRHFWSWSATQAEKNKPAPRGGKTPAPVAEPTGPAYQPFN